MSNYIFSSTSTTYTISTAAGGSGAINTTMGSNGTYWSGLNSNLTYGSITSAPAMVVNGDLNVDGNLKVKGKDLSKLMEKIEDRLAILSEPDEKKLEKFASLKKAYDHYKLMEKLIGEDG